jgi:hypothetical protein
LPIPTGFGVTVGVFIVRAAGSERAVMNASLVVVLAPPFNVVALVTGKFVEVVSPAT